MVHEPRARIYRGDSTGNWTRVVEPAMLFGAKSQKEGALSFGGSFSTRELTHVGNKNRTHAGTWREERGVRLEF